MQNDEEKTWEENIKQRFGSIHWTDAYHCTCFVKQDIDDLIDIIKDLIHQATSKAQAERTREIIELIDKEKYQSAPINILALKSSIQERYKL